MWNSVSWTTMLKIAVVVVVVCCTCQASPVRIEPRQPPYTGSAFSCTRWHVQAFMWLVESGTSLLTSYVLRCMSQWGQVCSFSAQAFTSRRTSQNHALKQCLENKTIDFWNMTQKYGQVQNVNLDLFGENIVNLVANFVSHLIDCYTSSSAIAERPRCRVG